MIQLVKKLPILVALAAAALALFVLPAGAQQSRNDDMSNEGREGQSLGQQLLQSTPPPSVTAGGERGGGTIHIAGQADIPVNQFVPGVDTTKVQALSNLKDADQATLDAAVAAKKQEMAQDPTAPSAAYRTIVNQHPQYASDVAGDTALWSQTTQALAPASLTQVQKTFADCTSTTSFTAGSNKTAGVNHQVSCEDMHALTDASIERQVSVSTKLITLIKKTYSVTQDQDIRFTVTDGTSKITSATVNLEWSGSVTGVSFTDYPTSFNNWAGTLHVASDPSQLVCRDTGGAFCTGGSLGCTCAETVTIHVTADVGELTESFLGNPATPLMASDGFCTAQWTCSDNSVHEVSGTSITADMVTPLYPTSPSNTPNSSMSPSVCWKANAKYQCPFNVGNFGCWTTPSGSTQCHTNSPNNTTATPGTTCLALQNNPKCRLQFSQCAQNAVGYENFCYVTTNVYNCPDAVSVGDISSTTHFDCSGTLRCAGEDCVDNSNQENNTGYTDIQGKLTALQHMLSDTTTDVSGTTIVAHPSGQKTTASADAATPAHRGSVATSSNPSAASIPTASNPNVRLFPGQAFECRKALGSTIDCCSETQSGGEKLWMTSYKSHERQGNAQIAKNMASQEGDPAKGAWADYADSKNWTLATRAKALTSRQETATEDQPTPGGGPSTDVTLTGVMRDYRATQGKNTGLQNDWMCTAEELDLATQREAGACANIGSYCSNSVLGACIEKRDVYCCFNSPMSLAIRLAQIGGQQGIVYGGFGTPKAPNCAAVSTDVVSTQTLTSTSTDDWIGRLQQAGDLPTVDNLLSRTSVDRLTGNGSSINPPGNPRPNLIERTQSRVASMNIDAAKSAIEKQAIAATPMPQAEPLVPGALSFSPAFNQAHAGMGAYVRVQRQGSLGPVSVSYSTADDSAIAGTDYVATNGTLSWADGESGDKTFVVKTLANPVAITSATTPLQLLIHLSNPTGGSTLYPNDSGEVVLNLAPPVPVSPPVNTTHLSVTKVLQNQQYDAGGGVTLTYLLTAINDGVGTLGAYDIVDNFPANAVVKQWGDPNDSSWRQYCSGSGSSVGFTSPPNASAWCAGTTPLGQGSTIQVLAVVYLANPGASVTNTCYGEYQSQQAGGNSQFYVTDRNSCVVTSAITGGLSPAQQCEKRGGMDTGFPVGPLQQWAGTFPSTANGSFSDDLYGQTQTDIMISVPSNPSVTSATIVVQPIGTPLITAMYARISPCAGDLSLPTNNPQDPFSMQGCTIADVSSGSVISHHSITIEISSSSPSDQGTCRLVPGQIYFLNTAAVDPTSGAISPNNATCQLGQTCTIQVSGN